MMGMISVGGRAWSGFGRSACAALACAAGLAWAAGAGAFQAPATPAQPPVEQPPAELRTGPVAELDGEAYRVSAFRFEYGRPVAGAPPVEDLVTAAIVELGETAEGFVAPRPGLNIVRVPITQLPDGTYYASGIRAVTTAVVREVFKRKIGGAFATPEPDIAVTTGEDLREGRTDLRIQIWVGVIGEVRTAASGDRQLDGNRINNPAHARIRERSPLQTGGLLQSTELDNYIFRLNRHPGRQVDVAVSAASSDPGAISLDYLVTESKPWRIYLQGNNTGTASTDEWRQRIGFVHNQLTGHDDILRIDFITALFDQANGVSVSYERPIFDDRLRIRPYGSWAEFTAADVGLSGESFEGENWQGGVELAGTVYQDGPLFLDVFGGAQYQNVRVTNTAVNQEGESGFFLPYVGLRLERMTEEATTFAQVQFETNISGIAGTDRNELIEMGRLDVDEDWFSVRWDVEHSFYLEPLINTRAWRGEVSDTRWQTLAHELAFSLRGLTAFNDRLIPSFQQVAGGLFTVRGYPESVVAGDSVVLGTAEYRFHLPRVLKIHEDPATTPLFGQPFRWSPTAPYGRADWDLIFRGFVDAGQSLNARKKGFERDETLIGAGVGVELQFKQNLQIRVDWGFALSEIEAIAGTEGVGSGDNRVHFLATFLY